MTSVMYFIGTVFSLLVFARFLNHLVHRQIILSVLALPVISNLVVGRVSEIYSLFQISIGYGTLVVIAWVITFITAVFNKQENIQNEVVKGECRVL